MTTTIFVYGNLKSPLRRNKLLDREVPAVPAKVSGFVRDEIVIEDRTYPCARHGNGCLEGILLDVDGNELEILDRHETDAYKRARTYTTSGEPVEIYVRNC